MKEFIHNSDNLKEEDCHKTVKRAKLIVENSKGELLFVKEDDSMFLIGGHVEDNEPDNTTLIREINEEAGIYFDPQVDKPFVVVKYLSKDYPNIGENTMYISNFYFIKSDDIIPNVSNLNLTEDEAKHGFSLVYIKREDALKELHEVYEKSTRVRGAILDTINAVETYLELENA